MDLLVTGQKLSILFPKGDMLVDITCKIVKVLNDRLIIDLPQYFMRYIKFLEVGSRLTVKVFTKMGTIDFNSIVISSPLEEEFTIEYDAEAIKLTPVNDIAVVNAMEVLNVKYNNSVLNLKTFELSTEYIKFYSDYAFKLDDNFDCELVLPKNYGIIKFKATIIDVDQVYDNEFTAIYSNMTEEDRQSLLYYMYVYSINSN